MDDGDTSSVGAAVSHRINGISTFLGACLHAIREIFSVGNFRTYTIGISLVHFTLGYKVKTHSLGLLTSSHARKSSSHGEKTEGSAFFFLPCASSFLQGLAYHKLPVEKSNWGFQITSEEGSLKPSKRYVYLS